MRKNSVKNTRINGAVQKELSFYDDCEAECDMIGRELI